MKKTDTPGQYTFRALFLLLSILFLSTIVCAQSGTEFWFAPPKISAGNILQVPEDYNEPILLRISTSGLASTVTISMPALGGAAFGGAGTIVINIPANTQHTEDLSLYKNDLFTAPWDTILNTGLKITATEEITVYYESNGRLNPDIFSLKGANALGTQFYTPFNNEFGNGSKDDPPYTSFDIVATEDNTTVWIYPRVDLEGGHLALQAYSIILDEGQTYSGAVANNSDGAVNPAGTAIASTKPIAVTIKDDFVEPGAGSCKDLMGDQIVPVDIVGYEYVVVKGSLTDPLERVMLTATQNFTQVFVDGLLETTLFAGETYPLIILNPLTHVLCSNPTYALHITGFGCEVGAALLPGLNCAGSAQVSFVRSSPANFGINVMVPAGNEGLFTIDGDPNLLQASDFAVVPGTGGTWVGAQKSYNLSEVDTGESHTIQNTGAVFAIGIFNGQNSGGGNRYGYFSEFSSKVFVEAGVDRSSCENADVANLGGSISGGAITGEWTSSGDGTFVPGVTDLNATYEPGPIDIANGSVTLTLTSTGNCFPVSDDMVVTFTPAPTVDPGIDADICLNNTTIKLSGAVTQAGGGQWSSPTGGTFLPNNLKLNATYNPTAADLANGSVTLTLTTVAMASNCVAVSEDVTFTFIEAPIVDAGPASLNICSNNSDITLNGSVSWAHGANPPVTWSTSSVVNPGTFDDPNALSTVYRPSGTELANGSVTLTLTSAATGSCNTVSDNIIVNFTPSPTIIFNPSSSDDVCANNNEINLSAFLTVATGGTWSGGLGSFSGGATGLVNNIYTPTAQEVLNGSVTLTLTTTTGNGNCNAVSSNLTVDILPSPIVTATTPNTNKCANNASVPLTGSVTTSAGTPGIGVWTTTGSGSFLPNASVSNPSYIPHPNDISSGSVVLTYTSMFSSPCLEESAQLTINFFPAPTVLVGTNPVSVCENNADVSLNGTIVDAFGIPLTGTWSSNGTGAFSPNASNLNGTYTPSAGDIGNGTVQLTLTSDPAGGCNSVQEILTVNFTPSPSVTATANPTTICTNNKNVVLNGTIVGASGGVWLGGLGVFSGGPNDLSNNIYTPTNAELSAGTFTLTLESTGNLNCNPVQDNVVISVVEQPIVNAGADFTYCTNNAAIPLNGNIQLFGPITGNSLWTSLGTGVFANPAAPVTNYTPSAADLLAGSVTLQLTYTSTSICNPVTDQVVVTFIDPPVVDAGPATLNICENNSVTALSGSISFAAGPKPASLWSTSGGGTFDNPNDLITNYNPTLADIAGGSGSITLTLTSSPTLGCLAESDNIVVNFTPEPTASIIAPAEVCANNSIITVSGSVTNAAGGTWSNVNGVFSGGSNDLTNNDYTPTLPEINNGSVTFILTTTGIGNCNAVQASRTVTIIDAPIVDAGSNQTVCANNASIALNGTVTSDAGGNGGSGTGQWSTSGTGSFANASNLNTTYTPSAADIAAGTVDLTLTSTLNGLCTSESDILTLTIVPSPVVDAGPPTVNICANNSDVNLAGSITFSTGAPPSGIWTTSGSGSFVNANNLSTTYLPSVADISGGTGSVTLTLTSAPIAGCLSEFDDITVNFTPAPTASIVAPAEVCANNSIISVNGSVSNATGGTWSNVNGTFSGGVNDLTNNDYTPTNPEINFGSVTFILTTDGVGNCLPVQASQTVDIIVSPIVDAGPDETVCANNANVNLAGTITNDAGGNGGMGTGVWSTSGTGSFSNPSNLNAIYTPSAADLAAGSVTLRLTSTANGLCSPEYDELVLTIIPSPAVNAGIDQSICANNAVTALNGVITFSSGVAPGGTWTTNGGGSFDNINDLITNYNPSAGDIAGGAGSVVLTLTSDPTMGCLPVTDNLTISFTPEPTANIVAVPEVCANNPVITLNGSVTNATGGTWSNVNGIFSGGVNDLTNNDYTPTVPEINSGTVTFILTTNGNGNCLPVQSSHTVAIIDAPTVDAGMDLTVCANNSAIALNGVINTDGGGNGGNGTGLWTTSGTGSFANASNLNTTYTPSAADIASGSVDLTLTSTLNGLCVSASDFLTLTIVPSPVVDAGPANVSICENNSVTSLNGSITFSSGAPPPGLWTTSGSGTFANPNNVITDYTPSAADLTTGMVTLTLTSSPTAGCLAESDDIIVSFTPAPTAIINAPSEVCANNSIITLNGTVTGAAGGTWSNVNGVFSGGVNDLVNNNYTPTVPEITAGSITFILTTTGVGNCNAVQTSHTVSIIEAPVVDAGVNQVVCANNANITLNGTVTTDPGGNGGLGTGQWSTSGTGSFANANNLNTTYTPSAADIAAGTVDLTLTSTVNGLCAGEADVITISIVPSPVVNAGPASANYCANNPNVDLTGSITFSSGAPPPGEWTTTGTGTFTNVNSLVTTYIPSAADIAGGLGSVTLTLTSDPTAGCISESDDIVINFTPEPVVNIVSVPEVCANNAVITLNGAISNATGGVWSNVNGIFSGGSSGLVNNDYSPTNPEIAFGSVTFILTSTGNGNCLPVSDSRIVNIIEAPTVDAGVNQTVCANNANIALSGTVMTDPGGNGGPGTGQWSTSGTGSFANINSLNTTYTPSAADITAGTVDITLTSTLNGLCFGASDVITLTIVPSPVVDAGPPTIDICANNSDVSLSGSITFSTGAPPPGVWSTSGSGSFVNPNSPITTYLPSAADITSGGVTLTLTSSPTAGCLSESDNILVRFTPAPVVNINSVPEVCANNSLITLNGTVTNATGGIWSNVNGTFSGGQTGLVTNDYSPTNPEIAFGSVTFILTSTGHGNCLPVSDSRTVTIIEAPTVDAGGNQTVCSNNASVTLNGTVTTDPGGSGGPGTGQWSTSGSGSFGNINNLNTIYTPSAADIAAGTVDLTLTSTLNGICLGASDVITILIIPAPVVDAGPISTDLCANNAIASLNGSINFTSGTPPDGLWTSNGSGTFDDPSDLSANYTPSAADITSGNVVLTLTSDGISGCLSESDAITINYTPAPTANAGADQVLCSNNSTVSLNGSVTVATGGSWSGGLGSFTPGANDLITSYHPTVGEISNDSVILVLSTTGNNNCNIVRDTLIAYFTPAPTAEAGPDQTVCANNPNVVLNGAISIATGATWSGGNGTFIPNNTTLSTNYTPSPAEIAARTVKLYLTTSGNGTCNPVTDSMLITITNAPIADAGPDQTACENNSTVSINGSVLVSSGGRWSGGLGSYTPSDTNLSIQYTPTAAEIATGNVILTLTTIDNGLCLAESDQMTITYTDAPTVNAGPDQTVSANNPDVTLNGTVVGAPGGTWSSGSGIFNPNKNTLNAVYTPSAGEIADDSVNLVLRSTGGAANCLAVRDTMTIFFDPAPIVEAGPPQTVCANNADIILNGSVTYAAGGQWSGGTGSYIPNNSTLNATYTPSPAEIAAGFAKLFLTSTGNGLSNPETDSVLFTITTAPSAHAGADKTVCANNATVSINGLVGIATGGIWSGGAGSYTPSDTNLAIQYTPTPVEIASGSVTLTLTTRGNGLCLAEDDEMTILFTPAPTADAGPDQIACANNATASLLGTVTVAAGGIWSGGGGTFTPNNQSLSVTYTPTLGEIANDSVDLVLSTRLNGNCNTVRDTMTVRFSPAPTVNAGPDQTICANNAEAHLSGSVTVSPDARWSGGSGLFIPNVFDLNAIYRPTPAEITAGQVTLYLTSLNNGLCTQVVDSMVITITPAPTVNAGLDITACANNPAVNLSGIVTVATGGIWQNGTGVFNPGNTFLNTQYIPSAAEVLAGTVTLILQSTGNGNCNPVSDQVVLNFSPAPTANAGPDQVLCSNNADVTLNGNVTVAAGGRWSGGAGFYNPGPNNLSIIYAPTASEIANDSVNLILETTGNGNCITERDTMTVFFDPSPVVNAGAPQTVCANNPDINLNGSVTIAGGAQWSGGTGVYFPTNTTLNAVYTPSAAEISAGFAKLYLTSIVNGLCNPVKDSVVFTITPAPVVNAGIDKSVCSNNPIVTINGLVSGSSGGRWLGGAGTYLPSDTVLGIQYTPTPAEIAAGSLTLTLQSTGNGLCNAETDQVTISFTPSPTADAGPDQIVCSNNADVILNGNVSVASGGNWIGGLGSFTPGSSALNAVYSPSQGEIANGFAELVLNTTGNANCLSVQDTMRISFLPAPIVEAGLDKSICSNNPTFNLSGSVSNAGGGIWTGGTGVFAPGNTSLNATYTPNAGEIAADTLVLYLTSTGNGLCLAEEDSVTIIFTPSPIVNAGPDITLCANNSLTTLNGSVQHAGGGTWSGGTGLFVPGINVLNPTYTPTVGEIAAGSLTLTLSSTGNGNCIAESDEIVITYSPAPTANAGPDQILCGNNADATLAGTVTVATGGTWSGGTGSFNPGPGSLSTVYTPTLFEIANGTLDLVLTTTGNGSCLAVTDTVNLSFSAATTVDAGPNTSVCANDPDVQLSGSVTVASGGIWTGGTGSFIPNNTNLNAIYTPSPAEIAAGSVKLFLTSTGNGTCLPVVDSIIVTITPAPTVSAGADQSICANFAQVNLNGIVTVASGGTWTGGLGIYTPSNNHLNAQYFPTPAEIASGSVTLTLTTTGNGQCIQVSDQMQITFTPAPTADAGPDQTLCSNNPNVTLNGSVTVASGGRWIGGLGSFNPNANVLSPVYTPTVGEITNDTLELILLTTGNGNCATVRDTMYVYFTPSPTINAGPDELVCANNADVQLGASFTQSGGMLWSGGTGVFAPNPTDPNATYIPSAFDKSQGSVTLYSASTNNGNCLAVEDSLKISINPAPVVNAGPDKTVCANNPSVNLSGSVGNAGGGKWIGGTGVFFPNDSSLSAQYTPSATDISAGSMILKLRTTGNGLCLAEEDSMQIVFTPAPDVNAGPDQIACANNSTITLAGVVNNAGGGQWSGGIGIFNPSSTNLSAAYSPTAGEILNGFVNLILTSTGNGNCFAESDTVTIQYNPAPTIDAGPDITVCETNPTASLLATVNGSSGVQWSGGTGSFTPSPNVMNPTYVASASEIASGSVTLTVSSTGNGTCNSVSDHMTLTFQSSPIANAGPDQSVCSNNAVANLGGQFVNATGGQWSGGAGMYVPSSLVLNPTYHPSPAEIALGGVNLIFSTTGNGVCSSASDTMFISITPAPTVSAGPDKQVCENNPVTMLIGQVNGAAGGQWSNVLGSFNPSSNALNTSYTPTLAEIASGSIDVVLSSTGNGNCLAVRDTMNISFAPAPQADAGTDIDACENNPLAQLSGTVLNSSTAGGVWTGGSGFFNPNAQTLNAIYTPSSSEIAFGQAVLTLVTTNVANCAQDSDEVVINIPPAPVVNAGLDITLCVTNLNAQLNGFISGSTNTGQWTTNGTGFFLPNNSALNATYVASSQDSINGQVRLILSSTNNGICNPASDTMRIYILPAGLSNAGPDQTVCENNAIISLAGSVSGGALSGFWTTSGTGIFDPSDSISNPLYIPSMQDRISGNVILTYTALSCNAGSDDMDLTITPAPEVNAGPDQSICDNLPSIQLAGSVSQGASTGSWTSTGTGSFSPNNQSLNASYSPSAADRINGGVLIILTSTLNGNCFAESDTMVLTFSDGIRADAGSDQRVCSTASYAQLQGQVSNGSTTGRWSSIGTGSFVPNDTALNAEYHFSAGDVANGSVLLVLASTNNGGCFPAKDTIKISFGPSVFVDAGDDRKLCRNSTNLPLSGFISGGSISGSWSTNGTGLFSPGNQFLNTTYALSAQDLNQNTLEFYLTSTNNGTCLPGFDTMVVTIVDEPLVNTGGPYVGCSYQNEVLLSPTLMNTKSILWSSSGTGFFLPNDTTRNAQYMPSLADIAAGDVNIELLGMGIANCPNISAFSRIDFISPVTAGFIWDEACQGQSVQFTDTSKVTSGQIDSWHWDFDNGITSATQFPFIEFKDAGNFDVTLVVSSSLGCDDSITHAVYVEPAPNARFSITPLLQKTNLPVNFVDNSDRATERIWDFGDGQGSVDAVTQHTYTDTGTYFVILIVRSELGCRDTATYNMVIEEDFIYTARVPNAFTPNGDGINDYLIIDGGPFTELELKIYNSWGNLLYESNDVNAAWDGTYKGQAQPNGDYIYTVKGVNVRGEQFNRSGSITLMR